MNTDMRAGLLLSVALIDWLLPALHASDLTRLGCLAPAEAAWAATLVSRLPLVAIVASMETAADEAHLLGLLRAIRDARTSESRRAIIAVHGVGARAETLAETSNLVTPHPPGGDARELVAVLEAQVTAAVGAAHASTLVTMRKTIDELERSLVAARTEKAKLKKRIDELEESEGWTYAAGATARA